MALSLLESHEQSGAPVGDDPMARRLLVGRFPHQVVYRLRARALVIVAFAHLHRRPGYWKQQRYVAGPPNALAISGRRSQSAASAHRQLLTAHGLQFPAQAIVFRPRAPRHNSWCV